MSNPKEIILVAAMAKNYVIGKGQDLPWHLPNDFKHFKTTTLNKTILMGRATFASIGNKPLPKRQHIILTRDQNFAAPENCRVAHDQAQALAACSDTELYIVGGQQIYQLFLPIATKMILTFIDADIEGDTFFPAWQEDEWQTIAVEEHTADEKHAFSYKFITFQRKA